MKGRNEGFLLTAPQENQEGLVSNVEGGSKWRGQHLGLGTMPITVSVIVLVEKPKARGELKRASLPTFPLDPILYGVQLKLTGSLANKFWGSFLPEGCHPFQSILGWDVLGIAHMFNGHP